MFTMNAEDAAVIILAVGHKKPSERSPEEAEALKAARVVLDNEAHYAVQTHAQRTRATQGED